METKQEKKSISGIRAILMMIALGLPYFFSNFYRYALSIIGGTIAADYQLSSAELGILGSALLYTYAAMQIPCGILSDKLSAKRMLVLSCILAAVASIWFAMSENFLSLVLARALTGVATALVYVPATTIIRRSFGDASYGVMIGVLIAMGKAGNVCAAAPLKFLNDALGWKLTFTIIGGISLLIAVLASCLVVEPRREKKRVRQTIPPETLRLRREDRRHLCTAGAISIMLWFFLVAGTRLSFQSLWAGQYFDEAVHTGAYGSEYYLTVMSVGCIFGSMIFGKLSDRLGNYRALALCAVVFSGGWAGLAVMPEQPSMWVLAAICAVLGAAGAGTFTVCFSCVRSIVSPETTGLATGIYNFFAFFGSAMFTQLSTYIRQLSAGTMHQQFAFMLGIFVGITAGGLVLVVIANRRHLRSEGHKSMMIENASLE